MVKIQTIPTLTSFFIGIALATGLCLYFAQDHSSSSPSNQMNIPSYAQKPPTQIVEKVVTSSQLWRSVQKKVKDTVVQVFSHVTQTDLLHPYKSPAQGTSAGSGFFINDCELVTNYHVIAESRSVYIQVPSLGKRIIDVVVIGASPAHDLALLRLTDESKKLIEDELGTVPFLPLGDSDTIYRSDEVLALGYPLGLQSLKSTTGVVSGREQTLIQTSAALNPGNSGGPLLSNKGEVIGINASKTREAENMGYAIPSNILATILPDMRTNGLIRKPFLGILFNNATEALTHYLGNPEPGGCYITEVLKNSTLDQAGVKRSDMLYEINGHAVDLYGEMSVPWSEDKISIIDFVNRFSMGQELKVTIYRRGERKEFNVKMSAGDLPAVREIYPGFETIDYEVCCGMVVMPLCINHFPLLGNIAPGLIQYTDPQHQTDPVLIVTHIFNNSQVYRSRSLPVGSTINEVNGSKVRTLDEFRTALKKSIGSPYLTLRASDNVTRKSDNLLIVLPWDKVLEEEPKLAQDFRYRLSDNTKEVMRLAQASKALGAAA